MSRPSLRLTGFGIALGGVFAAAPARAQPQIVCRDTPAGRVCTVQQPIVGRAALV